MRKSIVFLLSAIGGVLLLASGYVFFLSPSPARAMLDTIPELKVACPLIVPYCPYGSHSIVANNGCNQTVCNTAPVVPAAPTAAISVNPTAITQGQATTITWTSTNASSCVASNALGESSLASSGSLFETPTAAGTYTYTIACSGSGGTSNPASAVVAVAATNVPSISSPITACPAGGCNSPKPVGPEPVVPISPRSVALAPTLDISGTSLLTNLGGNAYVIVKWSSENATSCVASGAWSGSQALTGTSVQEISPSTGKSTYTLTCSGAGGSASASAVVTAAGFATVSAPTITNINPTTGVGGTVATITGTGFTASNQIDFGSSNVISSVAAGNNGTSLSFTIPVLPTGPIAPACAVGTPCPEYIPAIGQPVVYQVSVVNANGTSNAMSFTVPGSSRSILSPTSTSYTAVLAEIQKATSTKAIYALAEGAGLKVSSSTQIYTDETDIQILVTDPNTGAVLAAVTEYEDEFPSSTSTADVAFRTSPASILSDDLSASTISIAPVVSAEAKNTIMGYLDKLLAPSVACAQTVGGGSTVVGNDTGMLATCAVAGTNGSATVLSYGNGAPMGVINPQVDIVAQGFQADFPDYLAAAQAGIAAIGLSTSNPGGNLLSVVLNTDPTTNEMATDPTTGYLFEGIALSISTQQPDGTYSNSVASNVFINNIVTVVNKIAPAGASLAAIDSSIDGFIQSTVSHETLHNMGLGHTTDPTNIMYAYPDNPTAQDLENNALHDQLFAAGQLTVNPAQQQLLKDLAAGKTIQVDPDSCGAACGPGSGMVDTVAFNDQCKSQEDLCGSGAVAGAPANSIWNDQTQKCDVCQAGTTANLSMGECDPTPDCGNALNSVWNNQTQSCSQCPANTIADLGTGQCVSTQSNLQIPTSTTSTVLNCAYNTDGSLMAGSDAGCPATAATTATPSSTDSNATCTTNTDGGQTCTCNLGYSYNQTNGSCGVVNCSTENTTDPTCGVDCVNDPTNPACVSNCTANPGALGCPNVDCTQNPTDPNCSSTGVNCVQNPSDPSCSASNNDDYCAQNLTDPSCATYCAGDSLSPVCTGDNSLNDSNYCENNLSDPSCSSGGTNTDNNNTDSGITNGNGGTSGGDTWAVGGGCDTSNDEDWTCGY
jgi:hypothetical protein